VGEAPPAGGAMVRADDAVMVGWTQAYGWGWS